eukprot:g8157.t1
MLEHAMVMVHVDKGTPARVIGVLLGMSERALAALETGEGHAYPFVDGPTSSGDPQRQQTLPALELRRMGSPLSQAKRFEFDHLQGLRPRAKTSLDESWDEDGVAREGDDSDFEDARDVDRLESIRSRDNTGNDASDEDGGEFYLALETERPETLGSELVDRLESIRSRDNTATDASDEDGDQFKFALETQRPEILGSELLDEVAGISPPVAGTGTGTGTAPLGSLPPTHLGGQQDEEEERAFPLLSDGGGQFAFPVGKHSPMSSSSTPSSPSSSSSSSSSSRPSSRSSCISSNLTEDEGDKEEEEEQQQRERQPSFASASKESTGAIGGGGGDTTTVGPPGGASPTPNSHPQSVSKSLPVSPDPGAGDPQHVVPETPSSSSRPQTPSSCSRNSANIATPTSSGSRGRRRKTPGTPSSSGSRGLRRIMTTPNRMMTTPNRKKIAPRSASAPALPLPLPALPLPPTHQEQGLRDRELQAATDSVAAAQGGGGVLVGDAGEGVPPEQSRARAPIDGSLVAASSLAGGEAGGDGIGGGRGDAEGEFEGRGVVPGPTARAKSFMERGSKHIIQGSASAQSRLRRGASIGESPDGSLQHQEPGAGAAEGGSGKGTSEAGRSRSRVLWLLWPGLAPQGSNEDGGEGGGSGGMEAGRGGGELEAGRRAPATVLLSRSRSWSFGHLPRPWKASPQALWGDGDGDGGSVGEEKAAATRGPVPVTKTRSLMERLPKPKQVLQALQDGLGNRDATLTAQHKPIVLAEALPAFAVSSVIASTLALFLVGIGLTLSGIFRGSSTLDVPWAAASSANTGGGGGGYICGDATTSAAVPDPSGAPSAFGCTDLASTAESVLSLDASAASSSLTAVTTAARYGAVFEGDFAGIDGLYGSVSLRAAFAGDEDAESLVDEGGSIGEPGVVDVMVEACTDGATGEWGVCEGGWEPVFQEVDLPLGSNVLADEDAVYTVFKFHQNQESVRGSATIRQYRVLVGFVASTTTSSSSTATATADFSRLTSVRWTLDYETGATGRGVWVALLCVLMLWLAGWVSWCYVVIFRRGAREGDLQAKNEALYEHRCLAFMGLSAALCVNPVMVVGGLADPESASWGLAGEVFLSLGVAVFLVAALCMADGVPRRSVEDTVTAALVRFYAPKSKATTSAKSRRKTDLAEAGSEGGIGFCERQRQRQREREPGVGRGVMMGVYVQELMRLDRGYGCVIEAPPVHPGLMGLVLPWNDALSHRLLVGMARETSVFIGIGRDRSSNDNRVVLGPKGDPVIKYTLGEEDSRVILQGRSEMLRMMRKAGASMVLPAHEGAPWFCPKDGKEGDEQFQDYVDTIESLGTTVNEAGVYSAHQMGSCRLSANPEDGPLRETGETWECDGLFVADASVFPTSLGINPMITVEAVAYMVADQVATRLGKEAESAIPRGESSPLRRKIKTFGKAVVAAMSRESSCASDPGMDEGGKDKVEAWGVLPQSPLRVKTKSNTGLGDDFGVELGDLSW